jgi:hypothetical protein
LEIRLGRLGTPIPGIEYERMATILMGLTSGVMRERMVDADAVPDELLGQAIILLYRGALASGEAD